MNTSLVWVKFLTLWAFVFWSSLQFCLLIGELRSFILRVLMKYMVVHYHYLLYLLVYHLFSFLMLLLLFIDLTGFLCVCSCVQSVSVFPTAALVFTCLMSWSFPGNILFSIWKDRFSGKLIWIGTYILLGLEILHILLVFKFCGLEICPEANWVPFMCKYFISLWLPQKLSSSTPVYLWL